MNKGFCHSLIAGITIGAVVTGLEVQSLAEATAAFAEEITSL